MKRAMVLIILIFAALAVCACGASESREPVLAPAIEAGSLAPAPENSAPLAQTPAPQQPAPAKEEPQTQPAAASAELKLYLNGNRLVLATPPVLKNGVVMAPVAEICAAFSREITALQSADTLTLTDVSRGNEIVLTAGLATAQLNGGETALDAPCELSADGALLMPLSAFRSLFDADNKFTAEYSSAYIVESGLC